MSACGGVRASILFVAALFALHLATAAGYVDDTDVNYGGWKRPEYSTEPSPAAATAAAEQQPMWCDPRTDPRGRQDCGVLGTTPQQCSYSGCCYNALVPNVPYCYHPNTDIPPPGCDVATPDRRNCGGQGVDEAACYYENCCWSPLSDGTSGPWCYQKA